jgi:methionine-rich copper-binding protein CopC
MSIRAVVTVIVAAVGFAALSTGPAFAHAELVGSSPAADSSVSNVTEVSITAGEELLDIGANSAGFVMVVTDSTGLYYGDGCVSVTGDTASMPVSISAAGDYSVAYRVVSNDGHPVEGGFSFTFTGDNTATQGVGSVERPTCGKSAATAAADITPWIGFATVPLILGAIWILIRTLGTRKSEDHLN